VTPTAARVSDTSSARMAKLPQQSGHRAYSQELVRVHLGRSALAKRFGVKARDVERALFMAHREYQEGRRYRRPGDRRRRAGLRHRNPLVPMATPARIARPPITSDGLGTSFTQTTAIAVDNGGTR
jgi:hypothetical protein